ncbi:aldo/keto reductase [Streptomyces chengbuensis]|uniref:aldo/keto reductase n=1 Tax=Streptomyces chengbuensis TaxID=3053466 RepID=UPI0033B1772F
MPPTGTRPKPRPPTGPGSRGPSGRRRPGSPADRAAGASYARGAATTVSAGVRPCGRRSQSGCRSPARRLDERRVDAWRVSRAATLADLRNWAPVAGIQVEYSLVERTTDRELLPMAEALGLGAALWPPLGGGLLTGKYRRGTDGRLSDLRTLVHTESSDQKTAVVDTVLAVAEETGASPAQVSVARLRERAARATTSYVPIIGPRNTAQLEDYLGALEVASPRTSTTASPR